MDVGRHSLAVAAHVDKRALLQNQLRQHSTRLAQPMLHIHLGRLVATEGGVELSQKSFALEARELCFEDVVFRGAPAAKEEVALHCFV